MKNVAKNTYTYIINIIYFIYTMITKKIPKKVYEFTGKIIDNIKGHYINAIYIPSKIEDIKNTEFVTTEQKVNNFFSMSTKSHLILWISGISLLFTLLVAFPTAFYLGFKTVEYVKAEKEVINEYQEEIIIEEQKNLADNNVNVSEGSDVEDVKESVNYQELQQPQAFVVTSNSGLNVRSSTSLIKSDNIVDTLNFGDIVKVVRFVNDDWAKLSNGNYVYRKYIASN